MILQKVQGQMCKYFSKNTSTRSITLFSSISDASWRRGFGKDFAQMMYTELLKCFLDIFNGFSTLKRLVLLLELLFWKLSALLWALLFRGKVYITGTKNALKHTVKHKTFKNDGYFIRESKVTLRILKLAKKFCKTIDLTESNKYVIEVSKLLS